MGILNALRSGIKVADSVTLDAQATVKHSAFLSQSADGTRVFGSAVNRPAVVEYKLQQVRVTSGELAQSHASVLFPRKVAVDIRDQIVLPDGYAQPILAVNGFADAAQGGRLYTEVLLGMMMVPTRNSLLELVPQHSRIAELGVFRGEFAQKILQVCRPSELHLIDTWEGRAECGDKDGLNVEVIDDMSVVYEQLSRSLAWPGRPYVELHRGTTQAQLSLFEDDYFDFIYVDADHNEESVFADLTLAWAKSCGMLGGHDYCEMYPGVMRAVDRFCVENAWSITHLTRDRCPSYLLQWDAEKLVCE